MKYNILALVLAAGFTGALPAHAAIFGEDIDVTARKQIAEQQRRFDALSAQYNEVTSKLGKLEEAIKTQSSNQPVLELANQMQVLREELRSIRGQLEVMSNNLEAGAKRQRDMYVDLDTRLRRFEQTAPAAPIAPGAGVSTPVTATSSTAAGVAPAVPGSATAATTGAATGTAAAADEARVYEAAQNQRKVGNYQAAIVAFQSFVQQFARSPLAHRAQYWIGDSYFNLRDFKNAIISQQKLIATYPDSASVPDGLLNMASAYLELGDNASAKKTMDNLVARYPASEAAEKAKRRLTSMR